MDSAFDPVQTNYAAYWYGLLRQGDRSISVLGKVYTYRRGLRRCSFNNAGQCEGLNPWDE